MIRKGHLKDHLPHFHKEEELMNKEIKISQSKLDFF